MNNIAEQKLEIDSTGRELLVSFYPYFVACFAIMLATNASMLLDPVVGEMHPFVTHRRWISESGK